MKPRRVPGTGATALQRRRSRRRPRSTSAFRAIGKAHSIRSDPALPAAVSRLRRQDRVDVRARHDGSRDPGPSPGALRAGGVAGPDFDGHRRRARDRGRTGRSRRAIRWFSSTPSGSRLVLGLDPRIRDEGLVRNKAVYVALGGRPASKIYGYLLRDMASSAQTTSGRPTSPTFQSGAAFSIWW